MFDILRFIVVDGSVRGLLRAMVPPQIHQAEVRRDMAPLEFTLQSVPDMVLRVVDSADGQPVSHAKIEAVWHGEGSKPKSLCEEERTSQLGLCVLSDLPKEKITCRVSKRGHEPQEFTLPSTLEEHVVELKRKNTTIRIGTKRPKKTRRVRRTRLEARVLSFRASLCY